MAASAARMMALAIAWILSARVACSSVRNQKDPVDPSYIGKYMNDAGDVQAKAEKRHQVGIEKGHLLSALYNNCTVRYLDSKHIEDLVRKRAGIKVNTSQYEAAVLEEKIAAATDADKVRDINGDSPYLSWIDKRADELAEQEFYNQIISNANIVSARSDVGLKDTEVLEKQVSNEMDNLDRFHLPAEVQLEHADKVYEDAMMLWKQWTDSSKDYSCGEPMVVDHAQEQCNDGNTKFSIKCQITCIPGYDDNTSVNSLRCRKMGKFGMELFGEWRGYASCIGRLCGVPSKIDKAKNLVGEVRFPNSAEYTCYEGYTQTGDATGNKKFLVPCDTSGNFAQNISHACQRVTCGEAPVVENTEKIEGTYYYSDMITYQCLEGYTLDGTAGGLKTFARTCQATGQFSVAQVCKPVRCGPPVHYDHTSLTKGSYDDEEYYSDEVEYKCKPGYSLDQKPASVTNVGYTLRCGAQGEFRLKGSPGTLEVPKCSPVSAGIPDEVPHGALHRIEMFFGQHVVVTADPGYSTTGEHGGPISFVLSVATDGTFEGREDFKPVSCGDAPKVNNAATSFTGVSVYGDFLKYSCKRGYSIDASPDEAALTFHLECEADGSLSRVPGLKECVNIDDCKDHTCGPYGECVDHLENYTCNCDSGYAMTKDNSTDELTCGNLDDCGPDACGVGQCVDGVNTYSCNCPEGYEVFTDVDTGETCLPKLCGTPPEISHAVTIPLVTQNQKAFYLDNIVYKCEHGYSLDGKAHGIKDFSIDCQASQQFTAHAPCLPITCGKPPDVADATADATSATYNQSITYTCATGYTADATADGEKSFSITCQATGEYGPASECLRVNCGEAPDEPFSLRPAGSLLYDQSADYECLNGYTLDGKKDGSTKFSIKCKADGNLTTPKHCLAKECGHPKDLIHVAHATTRDVGMVRYPSLSEVTCLDGYTIGGHPEDATGFNVACLATGEFEHYNEHSCQPVNCGALPPEIVNSTLKEVVDHEGKHATNQENLTYDSKAVYECNVGFAAGGEPDGHTEIHVECLTSGDFSIPQPKLLCRNVNDCEQHTCGAKGTCVDLIGPSPAYTCNCDFGYEMRTREDGEKVCGNVDDCKGKDCGVGTCVDLVGDYTCICPSGYYIGDVFGKKTCVPVNCRNETPAVAHGKQITHPVHTGPVNFPAFLHYKCDEGYSIDGTVTEAAQEFEALCKPSGDLTGLLSCQKISCGTPYVLPFTNLTHPSSPTKSIEYEDKAEYKCHDGYTVGGAVTGDTEFEVSCKASGQLTDPGVCEPVKCGSAPTIPNAHPSISGDVYFGMSLVYRCHTGYTLDGTPSGANFMSRHCKKDAQFSSLSDDQPCKPISGGVAPTIEHAHLVSYSGHPVHSLPVHIFYPHGLNYECEPGYSLTGQLGGPTHMSTRVTTMGTLVPALAGACHLITFTVNGLVKNARNGQALEGVSIRIEGTTLTTQAHFGHYTLEGVPSGDAVNFVFEAEGYIKTTKTLQIHDDLSVGGDADVSMSPKMSSDQWRAVVKWGERPRDLDTYAKWGYKKVFWYGTRRYGNGIRGTLEHDDTNSYGPETLHLTGVGRCRGDAYDCDINYEINDYGRNGNMKDTDVEVRLYTGERVAGSWKIGDCLGSVSADGNWWHVFTVDGKTNQLKWNCKQGGHAPGNLGLYDARLWRKRKQAAVHDSETSYANATQVNATVTEVSRKQGNLRTTSEKAAVPSRPSGIAKPKKTAESFHEMSKKNEDNQRNQRLRARLQSSEERLQSVEERLEKEPKTKSLRSVRAVVKVAAPSSPIASAHKDASPRLRSQVQTHLF